MAQYFKAVNINNNFIINDAFASYGLVEVFKLKDLNLNSEEHGQIKIWGKYLTDDRSYDVAGPDTYPTLTQNPYFVEFALGTKRRESLVFLYNPSEKQYPVYSYPEGRITIRSAAKQSGSLALGAISRGWSAGTNPASFTQLGAQGGFEASCFVEPSFLGCEYKQPCIVGWDNDANGSNLKEMYALVFSKTPTEPKSGDVGLFCYDANHKIVFNSNNLPLNPAEFIFGSADAWTDSHPYSSVNNKIVYGKNLTDYNYPHKIAIHTAITNCNAAPHLASSKLRLQRAIPICIGARVWEPGDGYGIYAPWGSPAIAWDSPQPAATCGGSSSFYSYIVLDITKIAETYNI